VGSSEVAETIQQVIIRYLQIRGESTSTGITAVDRTERPTASRSVRGRLGVAEQYRVQSKPLAVNRCPHFVLRLVSPEEVAPPANLPPLPVVWVTDLAAAITTTTTFTKGKK
jgi:hypothetical protein